MQGDEYDVFANGGSCRDEGLFEFYTEMLYTFPSAVASVNSIAFINKVMWAYISADQIRAKY